MSLLNNTVMDTASTIQKFRIKGCRAQAWTLLMIGPFLDRYVSQGLGVQLRLDGGRAGHAGCILLAGGASQPVAVCLPGPLFCLPGALHSDNLVTHLPIFHLSPGQKDPSDGQHLRVNRYCNIGFPLVAENCALCQARRNLHRR